MWITFKSESYDGIENDEIQVTAKINLDKIDYIIFFEEKIELYPTIEEAFYTIDKVLNKNFEEIKQKLMEL